MDLIDLDNFDFQRQFAIPAEVDEAEDALVEEIVQGGTASIPLLREDFVNVTTERLRQGIKNFIQHHEWLQPRIRECTCSQDFLEISQLLFVIQPGTALENYPSLWRDNCRIWEKFIEHRTDFNFLWYLEFVIANCKQYCVGNQRDNKTAGPFLILQNSIWKHAIIDFEYLHTFSAKRLTELDLRFPADLLDKAWTHEEEATHEIQIQTDALLDYPEGYHHRPWDKHKHHWRSFVQTADPTRDVDPALTVEFSFSNYLNFLGDTNRVMLLHHPRVYRTQEEDHRHDESTRLITSLNELKDLLENEDFFWTAYSAPVTFHGVALCCTQYLRIRIIITSVFATTWNSDEAHDLVHTDNEYIQRNLASVHETAQLRLSALTGPQPATRKDTLVLKNFTRFWTAHEENLTLQTN